MVLKIKLENKESKYFISLDKPEYTVYPDEEEILLQSGLKAEVEKVEVLQDNDTLTMVHLNITD